jgi:hypothetical protein
MYDAPKRYSTQFDPGQIDFTDGRWHHVAGTYDGKNLALYLDGVLSEQGKREHPDVQIDWSRAGHCIGRRAEHGDARWYWKGKVDDVMIFDRALTDGEIRRLYRAR